MIPAADSIIVWYICQLYIRQTVRLLQL